MYLLFAPAALAFFAIAAIQLREQFASAFATTR